MNHRETFAHLTNPVLEMLACMSPAEPTSRAMIASDLSIEIEDLAILLSRAKKRGYRIYGCSHALDKSTPRHEVPCLHMMPGEFARIRADCEAYFDRQDRKAAKEEAHRRRLAGAKRRPAEGKESKPRRAKRG